MFLLLEILGRCLLILEGGGRLAEVPLLGCREHGLVDHDELVALKDGKLVLVLSLHLFKGQLVVDGLDALLGSL